MVKEVSSAPERGENYTVRNFMFCTIEEVVKNPSGHCMYHQFNIHKFYVLPTQCICVFRMDLRTNSDYFPIQLSMTVFL
jgi:hypothetical protein